MSTIVVVIGLLIAAIGLLGLVSPRHLIHLVKSAQTPAGLYSAGGLRVLGVALWSAAPASGATDALRILGATTVAAGLVTPFFGLDHSRKPLEWWWSRRGTARAPGPALLSPSGCCSLIR